MSPYERIRDTYQANRDSNGMTWEELVGWHLANPSAYVIKAPDYFVMGRAVLKLGGDLCRDLTFHFKPEECDTWFLYAFAGNMSKAWAALPHELPWLAWERFGDPEKELRFHRSASLRRLSHLNGI